jgi:hypothetical protein
VDDRGGYIVLDGGLDETGTMRLTSEPASLPDGRLRINRMSWLDVSAERLRWLWEQSFDDGETWETSWEIHYRRAESD